MLGHSPKIITDGLVFYYDMANAQKSWKGRPSRNYVAYTPNYVNWNSQDAVVSQISTEIQRISSASNVAIDAIWWGGFNTGTADSATKISYSAYVRGQGTSYLQIHQVNTSPNTVAHMGISGNTITLDSSQWKRIEIKDIYQASGTASQNILVGLGAGVGNYVEVKNVQCEYQTFPSAYINPSLYTNGIRSNDQAIIDLVGSNTITANSLTYNSDGTFSFTASGQRAVTNITTFGNNATWEAWIYCTNGSASAYNMFMGRYLPYFSFYSGNRLYFSNNIGGTQKTIQTAATLTANTWYHATFTTSYDGTNTTMKIYTNGVETATGTFAGTQYDAYGYNFSIGDGYDANWYRFDGKVPVVKIYNRTLSAAEVKQNFNALRGRYGV